MPDLLVPSSSVNAAIADAARDPQSTHDLVPSNAAAQRFQQLKKRYLVSSAPGTGKRASLLHSLFNSGLDARSEQIVDQAIESFFRQSQLNPSVIRFLKAVLASGVPLNPKEDKVVFTREKHSVEVKTELYLPLREVFACVWMAINDLSAEAWPDTQGLTSIQMRDARINDLNQTIIEISKARPELCPPGIRNALLQTADGFMGKRLPIDHNDLLYMNLHQFIINLFKEELHINLPTDKDPKGDARILFAQQFKHLFLPWLLNNKMPQEVFTAFIRKGGSKVLEQYLLKAFHKVGIIPDKLLHKKIIEFSTTASFSRTPVDLTPFLATVSQWLVKHASFRFTSIAPNPKQNIVLQVIHWLQTGFYVDNTSDDTDGINVFYLINQMFEVFDKLKDARLLHVMASSEDPDIIQNYRNACEYFQGLLNSGHISFAPSDLLLLKQHLLLFNKGYVLSQKASYQDFITEFFTKWFDPNVVEEEYAYEQCSERARLFLMFEDICAREASLLQGPGSSTQSDAFIIYMNDEMLSELFSINPLPTEYQINRVLLHALWFEPKHWTPLFANRLFELLIYIKIQYTGTQADKYPEQLIKQLERVHARYLYYKAGRYEEANSCKYPTDEMEEWPVLTSTLINSDESFRLVKYLCALPNCSDRQIARLLDTANGFNPNARSCNEQSLLGYASQRSNKFIVQRLLAIDAQPNVLDLFGETPLARASMSDSKIVAQLLKQGSDANLSGYGRSKPLHRAAQKGEIESAQLLLGKGAEVNAKGTLGLTPLHEAARNGELAMVQFLINNSADVNSLTNDGLTPIYFALLHGHDQVVNHLLHVGAIIDESTKGILFKNKEHVGNYTDVINSLVDYNLNLCRIGLYDDEHVLAARIASKMIASLLCAGANPPGQIELNADETNLIRRGTLRILRAKYPVIDTLIPAHQYLHIQQGLFRAPRQPTIAETLTGPFELSEVCTIL